MAGWLFWIGVVGGALVLPAWRYLHRRRCLADERFPKDTEGKGILAGQTIAKSDQALLMRWQKRMIVVFVAAMASLPLFVVGAAILGLGQNQGMVYAFLALLLVVALSGGAIQFSAKCPSCRYRIGLQSRLLLPEACERCGVAFKHHDGQAPP